MYMRYTKFTHILDELAKKDKTFCLFYDNSLKTALRQSKNFQAAGKVLIKAVERFYEKNPSYDGRFDISYAFSADSYLLPDNSISDICLLIKTDSVDYIVSFDGDYHKATSLTSWSI